MQTYLLYVYATVYSTTSELLFPTHRLFLNLTVPFLPACQSVRPDAKGDLNNAKGRTFSVNNKPSICILRDGRVRMCWRSIPTLKGDFCVVI